MMNYEIVELEEKKIVGLTARTSNTDPEMGAVIGGLWNRFFTEGIYGQIGLKGNEKTLGIYSDYESNENGKYNITVACEVENAELRPSDTVTAVIPKGKYAKFIVRGHTQKAVAQFWQELWQMDLNRAFTYDFEEYQDSNMEDAQIHIYIALRD